MTIKLPKPKIIKYKNQPIKIYKFDIGIKKIKGFIASTKKRQIIINTKNQNKKTQRKTQKKLINRMHSTKSKINYFA